MSEFALRHDCHSYCGMDSFTLRYGIRQISENKKTRCKPLVYSAFSYWFKKRLFSFAFSLSSVGVLFGLVLIEEIGIEHVFTQASVNHLCSVGIK